MVFSRKDTLRLQPFRVAALEEYIRTLRRLLPETVAVRWMSAEPEAMIEVDPGALEQILLNLATNARDAMPRGGVLTISINTPAPDEVSISVSDSGTGMPAEVRERIFEPFFTTKVAGSGTGLGLSMVYGLVRQLRGSLEVESAPGHGTTFHMTFPRLSDTSTVDVTDVRVVEAPRHPGCTILVVEDEAGIRRVLERSLTRVGHTVLTAGDGLEALEVIRVHDDIDLVVSDVVMPNLGGPELLERARADGCTLPFLFMSGYEEQETRNRAGLAEDTVVLSKPWTSEELHDAVQRVLDASTARVDTS
jgi:two-component system cell cycle sensor histidine kinase/response regulator CckA